MTVTTPTPAIDHLPTGRNRSPRPIYRLFAATTLASTLIGAAAGIVANRPTETAPNHPHQPLALTAAAPAAKAVLAAAGTASGATMTPPVVDEVVVASLVASTPMEAAPSTTEAPAPTVPDGIAGGEVAESSWADESVLAADEPAPATADGGWAEALHRTEVTVGAGAETPQAWAPAPPTTVPVPVAPAPTVPAAQPHPAVDSLAPAGSSPFADELEARLLDLVNTERAAAGLPVLAGHWPIVQVARGWTAAMAAGAGLAHNPGYAQQIWASLACGTVAENVGYGMSLDQVHVALMQSPGHRANILNPAFTLIGVGVTWDANGLVWVTQNFCG